MKEAIIFVILGALLLFGAINYGPQVQSFLSVKNTTVENNSAAENVDSLKAEDLIVGRGEETKSGDTISVHYTGTLLDGVKFDSSLDRGQSFEFKLGGGQVIKGWDEGLVGMKVGGKRRLTIPPRLAYGNNSPSPKIPANSTLVFEVELLGIK